MNKSPMTTAEEGGRQSLPKDTSSQERGGLLAVSTANCCNNTLSHCCIQIPFQLPIASTSYILARHFVVRGYCVVIGGVGFADFTGVGVSGIVVVGVGIVDFGADDVVDIDGEVVVDIDGERVVNIVAEIILRL